MHWFSILHSVLNCAFGRFNEASTSVSSLHFGGVGFVLLFSLFCELLQILHGQAILCFMALLPDLEILVGQPLFLLPVLLSFLHSENLAILRNVEWTFFRRACQSHFSCSTEPGGLISRLGLIVFLD